MTKGQAQARLPSLGTGALFITHIVVTAIVLALLAFWWFGIHGESDNSAENNRQIKTLDVIGSQIELRLQNIQLLGKVVNDGILTNGSKSLIDHVRRIPDSIQKGAGLLAVSWWPKVANSAPRYVIRTDNSWSELNTLDKSTVAAARSKPWFTLAPHLATGNCLWSSPEREAMTGQAVLSCSRAVFDSREYFLGVLRFSFSTSAFSAALHSEPTKGILFLSNASGALLAANRSVYGDVRSMAGVGKREPGFAALTTSLHVERTDAIGRLQSKRNFPSHIAEALQAKLQSDVSANQIVAEAIAGPTELQAKARCLDGWCAEIRSLSGSPWRVTAIFEQPSIAALSHLTDSRNQPFIAFSITMILLAMLSYLSLIARWKSPLRRLAEPLARNEPGPTFNESLSGVWGVLAQKLNQLSEENQQLRHLRHNPLIVETESAALQIDLANIPLPAMIVGSNGEVVRANNEADAVFGVHINTNIREIVLERDENGDAFNLASLPDNWREEPCGLRNDAKETRLLVSTHRLPDSNAQLVIVGSQHVTTIRKNATSVAPQCDASASPLRYNLGLLSAPVRWLSLEVEPETLSPALAQHQSAEHFLEQIHARIEDRLIDDEHLLRWGPGHFVIATPDGVSDDRVDDILQAMQTSLIFHAGERIKVRARTATFVVHPHMTTQELDDNIADAIGEARGDTTTSDRPKTYSPETLTRLVKKGFTENRFQLITDHGAKPGSKGDVLSFRVLPHLEDDEGFWMSAGDYLPVVTRLKRRADHDSWLIDAVHGALQALSGPKPEQVIIPLCGYALTQSDNQVAEKLTALARDPALAESTIFVAINEHDSCRAEIDPSRLRNVVQNLGCRLAWSDVDMNTRSFAQIEAIRPDMIILRGSLVKAALESTTISIGIESVIRAGEKLKCSTVIPNVDAEAARQLVDKLQPTLAFGLAIGKPSPLPFRAVA